MKMFHVKHFHRTNYEFGGLQRVSMEEDEVGETLGASKARRRRRCSRRRSAALRCGDHILRIANSELSDAGGDRRLICRAWEEHCSVETSQTRDVESLLNRCIDTYRSTRSSGSLSGQWINIRSIGVENTKRTAHARIYEVKTNMGLSVSFDAKSDPGAICKLGCRLSIRR
jgi:hypothetical protein